MIRCWLSGAQLSKRPATTGNWDPTGSADPTARAVGVLAGRCAVAEAEATGLGDAAVTLVGWAGCGAAGEAIAHPKATIATLAATEIRVAPVNRTKPLRELPLGHTYCAYE